MPRYRHIGRAALPIPVDRFIRTPPYSRNYKRKKPEKAIWNRFFLGHGGVKCFP